MWAPIPFSYLRKDTMAMTYADVHELNKRFQEPKLTSGMTLV